MLYVIYGLTAAVGKVSREYLEQLGIEKIEKIVFVTDDVRVTPSDGVLNLVESEKQAVYKKNI